MSRIHCLVASLLVFGVSRTAAAQAERCRAVGTPVAPAAALAGSVQALGLADAEGRIRLGSASDVSFMDYQSDRQYPPYLWAGSEGVTAVAWPAGLTRFERSSGFAIVTDSARHAVVSPRGSQVVPSRSPNLLDERAIDPWAVLADWRTAPGVTTDGECLYRDFWRLVLSRPSGASRDRLFLEARSFMPVKLERREAHPLWGDVRAEYVWSIWMPVAGTAALAPRFAFRMADGQVQHQRQVPRYAFARADTTVEMSIPASAGPLMQATLPVDTVRVAENTFLLRSPSYTNVVTLQADTVWILDAQVGEERARQDSAWVGRLFPGRHPVVLVVTDLAHPHISGVRFWVASGATVISHELSRAFLGRVASRRWTLAPDKLEQTRRARLRYSGVSDGQARAGGRVQLVSIGGVASEGALMVYLPGQRFLYAGDYIQQGSASSFTVVYAREVLAAVRRAGLTPASFAAMHVPLTPWSALARFGVTPAP
jgi:hypothetical protein